MPRHQSADEPLPDPRGQRRPHPRPPSASPAAAFGLVSRDRRSSFALGALSAGGPGAHTRRI